MSTASIITNVAAPINVVARDRLLRLAQVKDTVGLGKTRIYELIKSGEFPAPCKPGGSASRWSENEVLSWVAGCTSQRLH